MSKLPAMSKEARDATRRAKAAIKRAEKAQEYVWHKGGVYLVARIRKADGSTITALI